MDTHLRASEFFIQDVPHAWAKKMIERLHYAKGCSNTGVYIHGLFARNAPCVMLGVALWIPPTPDAARNTYPSGDWRKVLSLSRLVIEEGMPTNSASFLIGRSIRKIEQGGEWECLVTYADGWRGHSGSIYRATNWQHVGTTKPHACWVRDGRLVARKAGPKTRTAAEMRILGCEMIGMFTKEKFVKFLKSKKKPVSQTPLVSMFDFL